MVIITCCVVATCILMIIILITISIVISFVVLDLKLSSKIFFHQFTAWISTISSMWFSASVINTFSIIFLPRFSTWNSTLISCWHVASVIMTFCIIFLQQFAAQNSVITFGLICWFCSILFFVQWSIFTLLIPNIATSGNIIIIVLITRKFTVFCRLITTGGFVI